MGSRALPALVNCCSDLGLEKRQVSGVMNIKGFLCLLDTHIVSLPDFPALTSHTLTTNSQLCLVSPLDLDSAVMEGPAGCTMVICGESHSSVRWTFSVTWSTPSPVLPVGCS